MRTNCALLGDWIWTGFDGHGWSRTSLVDGRREPLASLRGDGKTFAPYWIEPLPDGKRLLVGDDNGLWIVTPREQ